MLCLIGDVCVFNNCLLTDCIALLLLHCLQQRSCCGATQTHKRQPLSIETQYQSAISLFKSSVIALQVMLWSYPDTQRQPLSIETEHQANIFGVRFLPQTGDTRLVTCAMDYTVQLHQLDTPPASLHPPVRAASSTRRHPNLATTAASVRSVVYSCHRSRVKDVAVEPLNPHLFWSAAEDGCVRQFDTRVPTAQQRDYDSPNMLLCVRNKGRFAELKSLNLNPANPHQLAVAACDPLLRIYDRRMLTPAAPVRLAPPAQPLLALAPPHLAMATAAAGSGNGGRASRMHATYVAWGNRGDKVGRCAKQS
jgi:WD and tetratricopeptide repeat-containing protein 1